jgi:glycosyltransferase involved in cell wall biosynthesis
MPRMTILMPVYRPIDYLKGSLASVLEQDFSDYELIVLDNSVNAECEAVFKSAKDPRINYTWTGEKIGLFEKLNRGAKIADSPWLRLWADDDNMLPGSLSSFMEFVHCHPTVGLVYSDFFSIDPNGTRTGGDNKFLNQRERTPELVKGELSTFLFWCYGCLPGNISTVMLRREAWQECGGFLTGFQQVPDFDMWIRVGGKYPIGFLPEKAIELRTHPKQLSQSKERYLIVADEEIPVTLRLKERLQQTIPEGELMRLWRIQRGRQYAHSLIRALIGGDIASVSGIWRALKIMGNPWLQMWIWLISVNGRLISTAASADKLFDKYSSVIPNEAAR